MYSTYLLYYVVKVGLTPENSLPVSKGPEKMREFIPIENIVEVQMDEVDVIMRH